MSKNKKEVIEDKLKRSTRLPKIPKRMVGDLDVWDEDKNFVESMDKIDNPAPKGSWEHDLRSAELMKNWNKFTTSLYAGDPRAIIEAWDGLTSPQKRKALFLKLVPEYLLPEELRSDFKRKLGDIQESAILKNAIKFGEFTEKEAQDFIDSKKAQRKIIKEDMVNVSDFDIHKAIKQSKGVLENTKNALKILQMKEWIQKHKKERSDIETYEDLLDKKIELLRKKRDIKGWD